ncbi:MAG: D-alanine--D-alanine ligase [Actinobacteria bacterium]|nr:D-alanine--D-alanine ligase [Actinomycetota bacterium]
MTQKLRIGIIFGGQSAEHEVSLVSAASVINALDKTKYEIVPIGISKAGEWITGPDALEKLKNNSGENVMSVFLPPVPSVKHLVPIERENDISDFPQSFERLDVVFPVLHGTFGEDGLIQGVFEMADIPFVGAGVLGSSLSMDKILQKQVCTKFGLPGVDFLWLRGTDWQNHHKHGDTPLLLNQLANMSQNQMINVMVERLGLPVFVKPPNLGSSVGISKAHTQKELARAIDLALNYDKKVLIEKSVENAREIEVSVLGNDRLKASVAGEIIPSNEFYDYNAKYVDGASDLKIPADLPKDIHEAIQLMAIKAALATEVEGMARVDFLLDAETNRFFLNEINTIPGFTQISMYPKLWEASGIRYPQLLDELVRLAIERHKRRKRLNLSFQPKQEWYHE